MFTYGSAAMIISDGAREKPNVQDRQAGQSKIPMTLQDCEHTQEDMDLRTNPEPSKMR